MSIEQWEKRRDLLFNEDLDTDRVDQGLAYLGQSLGWSGIYGNITPINEQKRNLFNLTYGNIPETPQLGDQFIIFNGEGLATWVDYQGTEILDYTGTKFLFPGVQTAYSSTGFQLRESPVAYKGSCLYFDEPPLIEGANWEVQVDFIENKELWRVEVEGSRSFFLSAKSKESESLEIFIEDWEEGSTVTEEPDRFDNYYGSWGSKGTSFNIELLSRAVGVTGFFREDSLRIQPTTIKYDLPTLYLFDDILVDGESIGNRKIKGIENLTNFQSSEVIVKYNGGISPDLLFETLEVQATNSDTLITDTFDLTSLLLGQLQYKAVSSIRNSRATPEVETPSPFLAGSSTIGNPLGEEGDISYLRVPYHVKRKGDTWSRADKVVRYFSMFGKSMDTTLRVEKGYKEMPWSFYEESWKNWKKKRLFHEEYLFSRVFFDEYENIESGFESSNLEPSSPVEVGWKSSNISNYSAESDRNINSDGWVGGFYERVGEDNLSGYFSKDLESGKLAPARINETPYDFPKLLDYWLEDTNSCKVCYPYFTVGYSAPGDPVFDPAG